MTFEDFLYFKKYVTLRELGHLIYEQLNNTYATKPMDDGYLNTEISDEFVCCKKHPLGDVLDSMPELSKKVYHRASVTALAELVSQWHLWHCTNLEPICDYPISSTFGKNLYNHRMEKKRVASLLTRGNSHVIRDGDAVVIPDGSSATYVGLACGAFRNSVTTITSNNIFLREYLFNNQLAKRLGDLHLVGGRIDFDRSSQHSEVGAPYGAEAIASYAEGIAKSPVAAVVVMSSKGLTAEEGPFASNNEIAVLKRSIIDTAMASSKVRELIFISDYSKNDPAAKDHYGRPILSREEWRNCIRARNTKVSCVTASPEGYDESLGMKQLSKTSRVFAIEAKKFGDLFEDRFFLAH